MINPANPYNFITHIPLILFLPAQALYTIKAYIVLSGYDTPYKGDE